MQRLFQKALGIKKLLWISANTVVATVSKEGFVTAINDGTTRIYVFAEDGTKYSICTVIVGSGTVDVTEINLSQSSISIDEGKSLSLFAYIIPENAEQSVKWTSSNPSIASVNDSGVVVAHKGGQASITATSVNGAKTATCLVYVIGKEVTANAISLNRTSISLDVGSAGFQLKATLSPYDTTNQAIIWSTSDSNIATVSVTGFVKPVGEGTANITAHTADGKLSATCTVICKSNKLFSITLDRTSLSINEHARDYLHVSLNPSNASDTLYWTSSDNSVVSVSGNNNRAEIYAVSAGSATITVSSSTGLTAQCVVTVKKDIISIEDAEVSNIEEEYPWKGERVSPVPKIVINGELLYENEDYTLTYKNNNSVGVASVTITGSGNYTGSITQSFRIYPILKTPTSYSVSCKKSGQLTIKAKTKDDISGYVIAYRIGYNGKWKKIRISSNNKGLKRTIKKLKKKTYHVSVRTYKKVAANYYYSKWTKTVEISAKK